jgi:hypothetical protein
VFLIQYQKKKKNSDQKLKKQEKNKQHKRVFGFAGQIYVPGSWGRSMNEVLAACYGNKPSCTQLRHPNIRSPFRMETGVSWRGSCHAWRAGRNHALGSVTVDGKKGLISVP